jgi:hypothetical protein
MRSLVGSNSRSRRASIAKNHDLEETARLYKRRKLAASANAPSPTRQSLNPGDAPPTKSESLVVPPDWRQGVSLDVIRPRHDALAAGPIPGRSCSISRRTSRRLRPSSSENSCLAATGTPDPEQGLRPLSPTSPRAVRLLSAAGPPAADAQQSSRSAELSLLFCRAV